MAINFKVKSGMRIRIIYYSLITSINILSTPIQRIVELRSHFLRLVYWRKEGNVLQKIYTDKYCLRFLIHATLANGT